MGWGLRDRETYRERDRQLAVGVSEIAERDGNEFYSRRDRRELGGRWVGWSVVPGTGHRWQLGTFIKRNKTIKNVDANGLKMQHIKQTLKTTKQRNNKKNKRQKKKLKQKVHIKKR